MVPALASIAVAAYLLRWTTGSTFVLAFIAGPALFGCVLALVLPVRERWLLTPVLLLALAYWMLSWFGNAYDIDRTGLVVVTGLIAVSLFISWLVGIRIGRRLKRHRASTSNRVR